MPLKRCYPAVENQATDRAFRIGQKQNVLVHKFVCRGTVEEKIDALIELKRGLSKSQELNRTLILVQSEAGIAGKAGLASLATRREAPCRDFPEMRMISDRDTGWITRLLNGS